MAYKDPYDPRKLAKARLHAKRYRTEHPELERERWRRNSEHIRQIKKTWRIRNRQKRTETERQWKIKAFQLIGKGKTQCIDCPNTDSRILQIHHLNGRNGNKKDKGISLCYNVAHGKRATDDLILLCANCHLIRHASA